MYTSNAANFNSTFSGTPHGGNKMLVVDVAQAGGIVWQKSVTVQSNTPYTFTAWVRNPVIAGTNYANLPVITLKVDGVQVGSSSGSLLEGGAWVKLEGVWTSPCVVTGPVQIQITGNANTGYGADFCVDDISFSNCPVVKPVSPTVPAACVTRCGPGSLTLSATGACSYRWYDVYGTLVSSASQWNVNIATPQTINFYYVYAVNSQGALSQATLVKAITDPIRTTITTSTPALCAGSQGAYTIKVENLDCSASHNFSVSTQVTGPGVFTQISSNLPSGTVTVGPGQINTYYIDGSFSIPGNYTFNALVTDLATNCPANASLPVQISKGAFLIEQYVDGVCTEDVIFLQPNEITTSNTFDILDPASQTPTTPLNTCSSVGGSSCSMQAPATPGVYTVRNTAIIGNCTKVTTLPLHVFGKNRNFYFDGNDDRITAPDRGVYNVQMNEFTLEAWVTIAPGFSNEFALISKGDWHDKGFIFATGADGETLELTIEGKFTQSNLLSSIFACLLLFFIPGEPAIY